MARFRVTATALAAVALLWSSSAKATTITANGGTSPSDFVTIATGTIGESPSRLTFNNLPCCGPSSPFTVTGDAAYSLPVYPFSGGFNSGLVDYAGTGHLMLWFTFQGLNITSRVRRLDVRSIFSNNNGTPNTTVTLSAYLDLADSVAPPTSGTLLGSNTFLANGTVEGPMLVLPTENRPFSLTEVYDISAPTESAPEFFPQAFISVEITPEIPEPGTLWLLGTGVIGLFAMARRWLKLGT